MWKYPLLLLFGAGIHPEHAILHEEFSGLPALQQRLSGSIFLLHKKKKEEKEKKRKKFYSSAFVVLLKLQLLFYSCVFNPFSF